MLSTLLTANILLLERFVMEYPDALSALQRERIPDVLLTPAEAASAIGKDCSVALILTYLGYGALTYYRGERSGLTLVSLEEAAYSHFLWQHRKAVRGDFPYHLLNNKTEGDRVGQHYSLFVVQKYQEGRQARHACEARLRLEAVSRAAG